MITIEMPGLLPEASISGVTISCKSIESYEHTLRHFNAFESALSGLFVGRITTIRIGELDVTIELSEIADPKRSWLYRHIS